MVFLDSRLDGRLNEYPSCKNNTNRGKVKKKNGNFHQNPRHINYSYATYVKLQSNLTIDHLYKQIFLTKSSRFCKKKL